VVKVEAGVDTGVVGVGLDAVEIESSGAGERLKKDMRFETEYELVVKVVVFE